MRAGSGSGGTSGGRRGARGAVRCRHRLISLVEGGRRADRRVAVVVVVVGVGGSEDVVLQISFSVTAVAYGKSDRLAMTIVEGVVLIVVVVIEVAGPVTARMVPVVKMTIVPVVMMVPRMEVMIVERIVVTPAPAIVEAPVVITIIVGTNVVVRPPPVITQVDAVTPAVGVVVIPVGVGVPRIIVAPAVVDAGMESAESGGVIIIVIVIIVVGRQCISWAFNHVVFHYRL